MQLQEGLGGAAEQLLGKIQPHQGGLLGGEVGGGLIGDDLKEGLQAVVLNLEQVAEFSFGPRQVLVILPLGQHPQGGVRQVGCDLPVTDQIPFVRILLFLLRILAKNPHCRVLPSLSALFLPVVFGQHRLFSHCTPGPGICQSGPYKNRAAALHRAAGASLPGPAGFLCGRSAARAGEGKRVDFSLPLC